MAEASSPLTFRDSIRHLLPTAAAISLFAPLWTDDKFEVGGLVFASVLLGYIITTPLTAFLGWLYSFTPTMKVLSQRRMWIASNWDLTELFYNRLTQEEREYTYLTGSYVDFYRQLAFYLLLYTGINVFILIQSLIDNPTAERLHTILGTTTHVAGGLNLPTSLLIIFSALLGVYCFWDFINEYTVLFLENGIYAKFAEKSQTEKGGLALNICGLVRRQGVAVQGVKIDLIDPSDNVLESVNTNSDGFFQFKNKFKDFIGQQGKFKVYAGDKTVEKAVALELKSLPFTAIDLLSGDQKNLLLGWRAFGTICVLLSIILGICLLCFDLITVIDLIASLPFIAFLVVFLLGNKEALRDWKLSASLLASAMLAVTKILWCARNMIHFAAADVGLRSGTPFDLVDGWFRCAPPILLLAAFFAINRLNVESKIVFPTSSQAQT